MVGPFGGVAVETDAPVCFADRPSECRRQATSGSGRPPRVPVMQATDHGQLDHFAHLRSLDLTPGGRVLAQGQVRPARMIQVPTRVITRPTSGRYTTRGILCTGRTSSYTARRPVRGACFAARSMMTTGATTARCRRGCSTEASVPRCSIRRSHRSPGRRCSICSACSMRLHGLTLRR